MKTTTPMSAVVPIKKEDLFFALVRIFQLIEDIDPNIDGVDTASDDMDLEDDAALDGVHGEGDVEEDNVPNHFQALLDDECDALSTYMVNTANEYIGLFALLIAPLEDDRALKREFQTYALREHGVDIQFTSSNKKPKLRIVPPPKDPPTPETEGGPKK